MFTVLSDLQGGWALAQGTSRSALISANSRASQKQVQEYRALSCKNITCCSTNQVTANATWLAHGSERTCCLVCICCCSCLLEYELVGSHMGMAWFVSCGKPSISLGTQASLPYPCRPGARVSDACLNPRALLVGLLS